MLFKFKKKKITLDFYTDNYAVYDLFKIEKTNRHKPKWLTTDLPIKHCAGLTDFMSRSYVIRSWSEILIHYNNDGTVFTAASDPLLAIEENPISDRGLFLPQDKYQHLKIMVPWYAYPSHSIPCAFYGASWHNDRYIDYLSYLPSIRDFYYSRLWNVHFILNKTNMPNETEIINPGDPLQYFIPLTDKKVEVRNHYDPDMVNRLKDYQPQLFSLQGKCYFRLKSLIKNKENRK